MRICGMQLKQSLEGNLQLLRNFLFTYLFIYFWLHWVFVATCGLSLVAVSGGYSSLRCAGFSSQWLFLLQSMGSSTRASVVVASGLSSCGLRALEHRLSSCGARAQLLRGMSDLPGPGLEPVSPALAGGFLTTAPSGKPRKFIALSASIRQKEMYKTNDQSFHLTKVEKEEQIKPKLKEGNNKDESRNQ